MEDRTTAAILDAFPLILPEIILAFVACVLFLGGAFRSGRNLWGGVALLGLVGAAVALFFLPAPDPASQTAVYAGPFYLDQLAWTVKLLAIIGGIVLVLLSWDEVPDRQAADYHACLLIITAGLALTGTANELVVLFLSLELISIPTYVLMYLPRHEERTQEAALKYFLLSVFSSALLLFGFSYLYGLSGTTNIPAVVDALTSRGVQSLPAVVVIALVMVVAGLCFRITAVPFHFYAPDVYQGTTVPAAALLAFVPKVAGFVALLRVLGLVWAGRQGAEQPLGAQTPLLLWILAAVTMTLGNILALLQHNIKRLLAYSSVAHAGYMLIGLTVAHRLAVANRDINPEASNRLPGGAEAIVFYLVAYGAMTIGVFAVLAYLSTPERPVETEDDVAGLSRSHPGVALLTALFLFSLIGIPATAGFWGKLWLFWGALAVEGERMVLYRWLAVIGVINAAIGGWYYLRIIGKMYLQTPVVPLEGRRPLPCLLVLWICALLTLGFGIYPEPLRQQAAKAGGTPVVAPLTETRPEAGTRAGAGASPLSVPRF